MNSKEGLKKNIVNAVMWKGMERVFAQTVSLIVSIVLARILVPEDYSVVGIVAICISFCDLFISNGLSSSLIQKKESDILDFSTVLTANIVLALFFYILLFFSSPMISRLYHSSLLIPSLRIMGLLLFVNAYKSVLVAKISVEMLFKHFFKATLCGTIISAVIGIIMALKGYGVWALVFQQLLNSIIDTIFLHLSTGYRFGLQFSFDRFRRLYNYSVKIMMASVISLIYDEIRPLIVGVRYSTTDLAFYKKASSFPNVINSIGSNTLSSALFPAMSKAQDQKEVLLRILRRYIELASLVVFPMMFGLMAIANNFVYAVLTEKWMPIVPYLYLFCVSYGLDLIQVGNLQAIKAIGRSDLIFKMEIIKKSCYFLVIGLFLLFSKDVIMIAASTIVCSLVATVINTYPTRHLLGYKIKDQISDVLHNLILSIVMFFIVKKIDIIEISVILKLLIQIIIGVLVFLLLCVISHNKSMYYLLSQLKNKKMIEGTNKE